MYTSNHQQLIKNDIVIVRTKQYVSELHFIHPTYGATPIPIKTVFGKRAQKKSAINICPTAICLQARPWSTMEHSQPAAWTTKRSLLVASRVKAFPRRPTNSGSTLPSAAHQDGGVIGCHQCITSHSGNATVSPDMRTAPPPRLYPACIPSTTAITAPSNPP